MEVWRAAWAGMSVYIDVSGTPARGYRICRQVIRTDDEAETNWTLTPAQSRQLRTALGDSVVSDALAPSEPASAGFDRALQEALTHLSPAPEPFTHWTFD